MAHQLHELDHGVFGSAKAAWHGIGTVVDGNPTSREALHLARLDWTVSKEAAYASDGAGGFYPLAGKGDPGVALPDVWLTVRDDLDRSDPRRVLGTVGARYVPIQNAEAFDILDGIIGEGGAEIETAGSLFNGRVVFMTAKLPGNIAVKDDTVAKYLLLRTSHNGTSALEVMCTPVRVVCNNTLTWAINGAKNKFSIRHTANAADQIEEARRVLGFAAEHFDAATDQMNRLADERLDDAFVSSYLERLFPDPQAKPDAEKPPCTTRAKKTRNRISRLFYGEQRGADQDATDGTAYGLINAVSEYIDHDRTVSTHGAASKAETRMNTLLYGSGAALRQTAVDSLLSCIDLAATARAKAADDVLDGIDLDGLN